jgi:DNA transformation protein and related proteins
MPVSSSYKTYVLDQLRVVGKVTARSMFGGVGLYHEGLFFGLIADDTLYLKVDDSNRSDYERSGCGPFRPYGDDSYSMHYYELPAPVLEDAGELRIWAGKAIDVARRKASGKSSSPRRR